MYASQVNAPPMYSQSSIGQASDNAVGHLPGALIEYEKLVDTLTEELNALDARLDFVLRPSMPATSAGEGGSPQPIRSQCADQVQAINARLYMCLTRVRDISARADL